MKVKYVGNIEDIVVGEGETGIYVVPKEWDDYNYKVMNSVYYVEGVEKHYIGRTRIVHIDYGSDAKRNTHSLLESKQGKEIKLRGTKYVSLGNDDYYLNMFAMLGSKSGYILGDLNDLLLNYDMLTDLRLQAVKVNVVGRALLRDMPIEKIDYLRDKYLKGVGKLNYGIECGIEKESRLKIKSGEVSVLSGDTGGEIGVVKELVAKLLESVREEEIELDMTGVRVYPANIAVQKLVGVSWRTQGDNLLEVENSTGYRYVGLVHKLYKNGGVRLKAKNELVVEISTILEDISKDLVLTYRALELLKELEERRITSREVRGLLSRRLKGEEVEGEKSGNDERLGDMPYNVLKVLQNVLGLLLELEVNTVVVLEAPERELHMKILLGYMEIVKRMVRNVRGVLIVSTDSVQIMQDTKGRLVRKLKGGRLAPKLRVVEVETYANKEGVLQEVVLDVRGREREYYRELSEEFGANMMLCLGEEGIYALGKVSKKK